MLMSDGAHATTSGHVCRASERSRLVRFVVLIAMSRRLLQNVMQQIYDEVTCCLYTVDHNMDLPPDLVPPNSELARVPYFDLAKALAKVRAVLVGLTSDASVHGLFRSAL